jgi:hypothetical protein
MEDARPKHTFMRQQSIILRSLILVCAVSGACMASMRGNLDHGIAAGLLSLHTGPGAWLVLPPSEPVRLIVMGLSLIGISLLVRRWASR